MQSVPDSARSKDLRTIHTGKRHLAMSDDGYRAMLRRVTGKESSADLDGRERHAVIEELRRLGFKKLPPGRARQGKRAGARPMAMTEQASKIRALWISLYHLGEVADPSEEALAAFVARSVKVEALQWLDHRTADHVMRQLRAWCERVVFRLPTQAEAELIDEWRHLAKLEPPAGSAEGFAAKCRLIELLWTRLLEAGAFRHGSHADLGAWVRNRYAVAAPWFLDWSQADRAIEQLGRWLRTARGKKEVKA